VAALLVRCTDPAHRTHQLPAHTTSYLTLLPALPLHAAYRASAYLPCAAWAKLALRAPRDALLLLAPHIHTLPYIPAHGMPSSCLKTYLQRQPHTNNRHSLWYAMQLLLMHLYSTLSTLAPPLPPPRCVYSQQCQTEDDRQEAGGARHFCRRFGALYPFAHYPTRRTPYAAHITLTGDRNAAFL